MERIAILVEQSPWIVLLFLFVLGSVIGSFLNVVIYRLPRKMNIAWPPSQCTACGHPIRWYHNVPIFGWLWLRGRCRDCGVKISPRYPLIEFAVGLVFAAIGWLLIR
jgi:leader peptidase (prepilin peptidase) / N-methyltransferase